MLETLRLMLRPHELRDAPQLYKLNSDPEVVRFTGDGAFSSQNEAVGLIKGKLRQQFDEFRMGRFAVCLKDGTYIGWCGLRNFPEHREVDLGYRFFRQYWGQGFATEASRACLDYGFSELRMDRIIARAMPENVASIKVLLKLKMNYLGFTKESGDPHSFNLYELKRENFYPCAGS